MSLVGAIPQGFFMPWRRWTDAKRPCSFPGCPKLMDGRFCEEHERLENDHYEKYDRNHAVRRRGCAWKRIRDSYVQLHPLRGQFQEKGLLVPTEGAHHRTCFRKAAHTQEIIWLLSANRAMPESQPSAWWAFKKVQSIWHEGSLKVYDSIFHYWMKVYKEDNDTPVQSQSER